MPVSTPNVPNVTSSGTSLQEAIWHERRLEFAMESNRMWDLIRTGNLVDAVSKVNDTDRIGAGTNDEVRHAGIAENIKNLYEQTKMEFPVLPIPLNEVQSWGLQQNPN